MAIRQERMITLINAAIAYHDIAQHALQFFNKLDLSRLTHDQLRSQVTLGIAQIETAITEATKFNTSISIERDKFTRNLTRNKRRQQYMERQRRDAGIKPRREIKPLGEMDRITARAIEERQYIKPVDVIVPEYTPPQSERQAQIDKMIAEELAREAEDEGNMIERGTIINPGNFNESEPEEEE